MNVVSVNGVEPSRARRDDIQGLRALADTHASVICSIEIRTTQTDTHPRLEAFQNSEWHNGYFLAVCRKQG